MRRTILFQSDLFALVSYGGGTSYALHDHANKRSFFAQGDAAAELRREIESAERCFPDRPFDEIYRDLCAEYSDLMQPED
ncbi:MAG: hypothetical protein KGL39_05050 [Patescibacteria group bacterium]|nr:hypothetical protein [Patescibacteria group bacterium]